MTENALGIPTFNDNTQLDIFFSKTKKKPKHDKLFLITLVEMLVAKMMQHLLIFTWAAFDNFAKNMLVAYFTSL